jgi:hypothetical protein
LSEDDFEFVHHFQLDFVEVRELCAFAQHRFSKIEALPHGGFHCVAMRLVIGMDFRHGPSVLDRNASLLKTVPAIHSQSRRAGVDLLYQGLHWMPRLHPAFTTIVTVGPGSHSGRQICGLIHRDRAGVES